jgi:hypothetical protein
VEGRYLALLALQLEPTSSARMVAQHGLQLSVAEASSAAQVWRLAPHSLVALWGLAGSSDLASVVAGALDSLPMVLNQVVLAVLEESPARRVVHLVGTSRVEADKACLRKDWLHVEEVVLLVPSVPDVVGRSRQAALQEVLRVLVRSYSEGQPGYPVVLLAVQVQRYPALTEMTARLVSVRSHKQELRGNGKNRK